MSSSESVPREKVWRGSPPGLPSGVPPPSVPLGYFLAAAGGLLACGATLIWSRRYAVVDPTNDHVVASAHLAVLATLSMAMLGALHQFIPVLTQRALRSLALSRLTFLCWFAGSWLLPLGVGTRHEPVVVVGGAFAGVAVAMFAVNVWRALSVKEKGIIVTGLRLSVLSFVVTACFGALYAVDRGRRWFDLDGHVLVAHASVGLLGWLGLTYVSVSEKLWPMFMLAHVGGRRRWARLAVWAIAGGVTLLSPGLLLNVSWLAWSGAVVVTIGLVAHLVSLFQHVRARRRRTDVHLIFVTAASVWLLVGATLALDAALTISHDHHRGVALVAAAIVALGGWVLGAMVGHVYKVVPFVLWSALRGRGIDRFADGRPIMFADLFGAFGEVLSLASVNLGVAALCLGYCVSSTSLITLAGVALMFTAVVTCVNLSVAPLRLFARQRREASTTSL